MMLLGILAAQRVIAAVQAILPNGTFDTPDGWTVTSGPGGGIANGVLRLVNRRGSGVVAEHATAALLPNRTYELVGDSLETTGGAAISATLGVDTGTFLLDSGSPPGKFSGTITTSSSPANLFRIIGGSGVFDNIVVTLLPFLVNGDFAQAGAGWQASYTDSDGNDGIAGAEFVTFAGGACQLKYGGDDNASYNPRISRGLSVATVVEATYEVSFDLSWTSGSAAGEACYVTMGGKRQAFALTKGRVVMQIVATSASTSFILSGSRYDGPLVVDNIAVIKL